jgi:mevalonate kinase
MTLQIPGKTFLVGEYAVLAGGDSLLLATDPCFEVTINENTSVVNQFHPSSAAGLLLKNDDYPQISIHSLLKSLGGYGYSTAEFISAWLVKHKILTLESLKSTENLQKIFTDYLALYSSQNKNEQPSGADLVSMIMGRVTHFRKGAVGSLAHPWPFQDIDFAIISTGFKVNTHQHLANLNRDLLDDLLEPSQKVIESFLTSQSVQFIDDLKKWSIFLRQKEMQHNDSWSIKLNLEKIKSILVAKPNGALGADTITIFYETAFKNNVIGLVEKMGFTIHATSQNLNQGLKYVG